MRIRLRQQLMYEEPLIDQKKKNIIHFNNYLVEHDGRI